MENYMVVNSKICDVCVMGEYVEADISIVCSDGKYGLLHSERTPDGERELILPCEYDNLFFIKTEYEHNLIAVQQGKQGVLVFEGRTSGTYENISVVERIPCIYDYIEVGRENDVLFLHSGNKISCFHMQKEKIFTECDDFKEICYNTLLCVNGDSYGLWYTDFPRFICALETEDIFYLGDYEQGEVFMLKIWDKQKEDFEQQLLFSEYCGHGAHFSSKANTIRVRTKSSGKEPAVIGVEMSFSDIKDKLSIETVNEITMSKHSFE